LIELKNKEQNLRLFIGLASLGAFPIPKLGLISNSPIKNNLKKYFIKLYFFKKIAN